MNFSILTLVFEETILGLLMDREIVEVEYPVFLATSCIVIFFFLTKLKINKKNKTIIF